MASRIRPSSLPEIIAQSGQHGPGGAVESLTSGFVKGLDLAGTLAARKKQHDLNELKIQQIKDSIARAKEEKGFRDQLAEAQRPDMIGPLTEPQQKDFDTKSAAVQLMDKGDLAKRFLPEAKEPDASFTTPEQAKQFGVDLSESVPTTSFNIRLQQAQAGKGGSGDANSVLNKQLGEINKQIGTFSSQFNPETYDPEFAGHVDAEGNVTAKGKAVVKKFENLLKNRAKIQQQAGKATGVEYTEADLQEEIEATIPPELIAMEEALPETEGFFARLKNAIFGKKEKKAETPAQPEDDFTVEKL